MSLKTSKYVSAAYYFFTGHLKHITINKATCERPPSNPY